MASQKVAAVEAAKAAEDLSTKQYRLVKVNEAGELVLAGAGDVGFSLQDEPTKGQPGTYAVEGRAKAVAGGTIHAGEPLSSNSEGKLVAATETKVEAEKVKTLGTKIIGYALTSASSGDITAYEIESAGGRA